MRPVGQAACPLHLPVSNSLPSLGSEVDMLPEFCKSLSSAEIRPPPEKEGRAGVFLRALRGEKPGTGGGRQRRVSVVAGSTCPRRQCPGRMLLEQVSAGSPCLAGGRGFQFVKGFPSPTSGGEAGELLDPQGLAPGRPRGTVPSMSSDQLDP